jgi:PKD repeat protein
MRPNILQICLVLGVALLTFACNLKKVDDGGGNSCSNGPTANFTVDQTTGPAPLSVSFTNASTNATSYQWSFRDGGTSTDLSPSHTFVTAGNYEVFVIAIGSGSCRDTFYRTITVTGMVSNPPLAQFTVNGGGGVAPCTISFVNASQNASSFTWDFGDGSTSSDASPSHTYQTGGNFVAKLLVTSTTGVTDDTTVVVNVRKGFRKTYDPGANPAYIIASSQLPNGNYQVFYNENGYKSLILDREGNNATSVTPFSFGSNWTFLEGKPSADGGMVLVGYNWATNNAIAAAISPSQGVLWQHEFAFGGTAVRSYGYGVAILPNGETVICGGAEIPGNNTIGYARLSSLGNFLTNTIVEDVQTQGLTAYSVARKNDGNLLLATDDGFQAKFVTINTNGAFQTLTQYSGISNLRRMEPLGNDRFAVRASGQGQSFLDIVNASGQFIFYIDNSALNIIHYQPAEDANLVLVRQEDGIRITKANSTNGAGIWDKKITETGGTLQPFHLLRCVGDGFLVSGNIGLGTQTDMYFAKTDANGDWE